MSHPADGVSYSGYLRLNQLLAAQRPLTDQHDELLFVIYHQVTELWFKLVRHELDAVRRGLRADQARDCLAMLTRVRRILEQMNSEWAVLETISPSQFAEIRPHLQGASGLYSAQYRAIEFVLGGRDPRWNAAVVEQPGERRRDDLIEAPSLFDELLCHLYRRGHPVPRYYVSRDWSKPRPDTPELRAVLAGIRGNRARPEERSLLAGFVAVDEALLGWRQGHLRLVAMVIGRSAGTGGTSGLGYLVGGLGYRHFPELVEERAPTGCLP